MLVNKNCLSTSRPLRCDNMFSWSCLQDRWRLLKTRILRDIRRNETCKTVCFYQIRLFLPKKIVNFLENQKKMSHFNCQYLRIFWHLVVIGTCDNWHPSEISHPVSGYFPIRIFRAWLDLTIGWQRGMKYTTRLVVGISFSRQKFIEVDRHPAQ